MAPVHLMQVLMKSIAIEIVIMEPIAPKYCLLSIILVINAVNMYIGSTIRIQMAPCSQWINY